MHFIIACLTITIITGMEELIRNGIPAQLVDCNAVDAAETELDTTNNKFWEEYNKCCGYLEAFAADGRRIKIGIIGPGIILHQWLLWLAIASSASCC